MAKHKDNKEESNEEEKPLPEEELESVDAWIEDAKRITTKVDFMGRK